MKIYAYVDGELKFNFDINIPFEELKKNNRTYFGIKGSKELLAVCSKIEVQLKQSFHSNENGPSLEEINLDEINLNEYLIKKFPQVQQLELRADQESLISYGKNLFGKQYGYPLVWLNCNKYNHYILSAEKKHQWERCIYGSKLNLLDKIGSLTKYFQNKPEETFYQGDFNAWLSSIKNSFTDNFWLDTRRATSVEAEIGNMTDYDKTKCFAVYKNDDRNQITYITFNIEFALKASLEHLGGSKRIKILFPINVSNGKDAHVIMGSTALTKLQDVAQCNVTLYDALASDSFASQEALELNKIKKQIDKFFSEIKVAVELTTGVYNMKYQLPLQTHCGRFVMTWMAAEVAGLDIKKLSNYNDPFNYIFGQLSKNTLNFESDYQRGNPGTALGDFIQELNSFLKKRREAFKKQWSNSGQEDLDFTEALLKLIDNIKNKGPVETSKKLLVNLEKLSTAIVNVNLKNLVDKGMINLGFGSLGSFLARAQASDFSFSTRGSIALQYKKLDEMSAKLLEDFNEEKEDLSDNTSELGGEDDFEIMDIDETKLANNILPSKDLEAKVKVARLEPVNNEEELSEEEQNKFDQENQKLNPLID